MGKSNNKFSMCFLLISIILGTCGGYLLSSFLPADVVFGTEPDDVSALEDQITELEARLNATQSGRLVETKKLEANETSISFISTDGPATRVIPGLETTITVAHGSRIAVTLIHYYYIGLYPGFSGYSNYESAIEINGAEKIVGKMFAYRAVATVDSEGEGGMMNLYYITDPLLAGTYSVRAVYRRLATTQSGLTLIGGAFHELPQLTIQEYTDTLFLLHP